MIPLLAGLAAGGGIYLLLARKETSASSQMAARAAAIADFDAAHPGDPSPSSPSPSVLNPNGSQDFSPAPLPESFASSQPTFSDPLPSPVSFAPPKVVGPAQDLMFDPGSGLSVDGRPHEDQDDPSLLNQADNFVSNLLNPFSGDSDQ